MKGTIYAGMMESQQRDPTTATIVSVNSFCPTGKFTGCKPVHFRVMDRDAAAQEPGCRGFTATALLGTRSRQ
jgi:hypothetical protein